MATRHKSERLLKSGVLYYKSRDGILNSDLENIIMCSKIIIIIIIIIIILAQH